MKITKNGESSSWYVDKIEKIKGKVGYVKVTYEGQGQTEELFVKDFTIELY